VEVGQSNFTDSIANIPAMAACAPQMEPTPLPASHLSGRCGATLSFPRYALSDGTRLFIADGGNDRVLVFKTIPTQNGATRMWFWASLTNFERNQQRHVGAVGHRHHRYAHFAGLGRTEPVRTRFHNYRIMVFTPEVPNIPLAGIVNDASRAFTPPDRW